MFVFKCTVHFESVTFPGHGRNPYLNLLSIHHAHYYAHHAIIMMLEVKIDVVFNKLVD